ncbi:MAG: tellurite methyltransferase [Pirellulaceae bacterium]|jgi:tellurite methyltransferase
MSQYDRTKWDGKYAQGAPSDPSEVLVGLERFLPIEGTALDIAGGAGRHAIWLARRGLDVTIADVSPVGLSLAEQRAAEAGVIMKTQLIDLEDEGLPAAQWNLIVSVCFLWRPLFDHYARALAPSGRLIVVQPTKTNLERNDRPPEAFLLENGELPKLASDLNVIHFEEGWSADGRYDAVLVAQRKS